MTPALCCLHRDTTGKCFPLAQAISSLLKYYYSFMDSQLTIVVPVYNAEKVLPACLDSLRSQTVPVRILLADDGSTDGSPAITDTFASNHPLAQVLHLAHGGLPATRAAALSHVQTPFFAFLDADDTLDARFSEVMLLAAMKRNATLVFCPYRCIYDGIPRHVSYGSDIDSRFQGSVPIRRDPSLLLTIPSFFWGKIFQTDYFLQHIHFADESCAKLEDVVAMYPFLLDVPAISKVPDPLYRYAISAGSMCRDPRQELARLPALRELHRRFGELGALPSFLPQLYALNRCYLFDQLERLHNYVDPPHQHRVIREYFSHLDTTLPGWRPHPFHPTFYAAYWHAVVSWNAIRQKRRAQSNLSIHIL